MGVVYYPLTPLKVGPMRTFLATLLILGVATLASAQAVLVSPTSVRVTVAEAPGVVTTFHLALYPVGSIPSAATLIAAIDVPAGTPVSAGVYLVPLASVLSQVGPPQRLAPLTLMVSSMNAGGTSPAIAAVGSLQINPTPVAPGAPLSAVLVQ